MAQETPSPVRLLLVDDHVVLRMGLDSVFQDLASIVVVGQAATGEEAVRLARETRPDVVLLDVRLPDGSGIEVCRTILAELPETRVLILSAYADDEAVVAAIQAGAAGYLLKSVDPDRLAESVLRVASGASILDPQVTHTALEFMRGGGHPGLTEPLARLSAQEHRIALLVAQGKTNRQIADELSLSPYTIKAYISHILQKLKLSRRSQLAALVSHEPTD